MKTNTKITMAYIQSHLFRFALNSGSRFILITNMNRSAKKNEQEANTGPQLIKLISDFLLASNLPLDTIPMCIQAADAAEEQAALGELANLGVDRNSLNLVVTSKSGEIFKFINNNKNN